MGPCYQATEPPVQGMVGSCPQMVEMFRRIRKVAQTNSTVLISGESGTGKELVAKAIHNLSGRGGNEMVSVNCAAIPESLIESELFGHEKGAFPGATSIRTGLVETADGSTLFWIKLENFLLTQLDCSEYFKKARSEKLDQCNLRKSMFG